MTALSKRKIITSRLLLTFLLTATLAGAGSLQTQAIAKTSEQTAEQWSYKVCDVKHITYIPRSLKDAFTYGRSTHCLIPAILPTDEAWAIAEQKDTNFLKGNQYLYSGDWEDAIAEYTACLTHNPTNTSALANRSLTYYMAMFFPTRDPLKYTGHLSAKNSPRVTFLQQAMMKDLDKALKLHPECALLHRNLALQATFRISMFAASQEAEKALKLNPNSLICLHTAAVYASILGNKTPALKHINRAIKLSPSSALLFVERSLIDFALGQYEKGIDDTSEAISEEPDNAFAYRMRAVCYIVLHKFKEAFADLDRAVKLWPDYGEAYQTIAVANNELFRSAHAIGAAKKALQCGGDEFECNYIIGLALLNEKKYKAALTYYDVALRLDPASSKTYSDRAEAFAGLNEYKKALSSINRAIELNPNNSRALNLRAKYSAHTGSFEQSISDIFESKKLSAGPKPENKPKMVTGSYTLELAGPDIERTRLENAQQFKRGVTPTEDELKHAIEGYSRIIAMKQIGAAPYFSRGVLYMCQGKSRLAIDDLKEAQRLAEGGRIQVLSTILIAELWRDLNEKDRAKQALYETISPCPDAYFAKLLAFEKGDCKDLDLLRFTSPSTSGWAHYVIAKKLIAEGKYAEGKEALIWIKDKGNLGSEEYSLALALLSKSVRK